MIDKCRISPGDIFEVHDKLQRRFIEIRRNLETGTQITPTGSETSQI